jgi:hypothetical protein
VTATAPLPRTTSPDWPAGLAELTRRSMVSEYASLTRDGRPITWPVSPYLAEDGSTVDVSTGLTYPSKAERARRDPRVAVLLSSSVGTGIPDAPVVIVQGLATVRDADLQSNTDRYVRESMTKTPQNYKGMPKFALRTLDWYFGRIWIAVTPLRITVWPGGRLDRQPEIWTAPEGTTAPPSDPAPTGNPLPARTEPQSDWRDYADRAERLGAPVLTVVGEDGWPLAVRTRGAQRTADGFVVDLPAGVTTASGPACLTFHWHTDGMTQQENVVLLGTAQPTDDGRISVTVGRALVDWSITEGSALGRTVSFIRKGKALRARITAEAARRGQPAPVIRL